MNEDTAWKTLADALMEWGENHLDQFDKVKFKTGYGMVYVTISREDSYPSSFEEIDGTVP